MFLAALLRACLSTLSFNLSLSSSSSTVAGIITLYWEPIFEIISGHLTNTFVSMIYMFSMPSTNSVLLRSNLDRSTLPTTVTPISPAVNRFGSCSPNSTNCSSWALRIYFLTSSDICRCSIVESATMIVFNLALDVATLNSFGSNE